MPDIQTAMKQALTKTLTEWDDDEGTNVPVPSSKQPVSLSSVPTQGIPMKKAFNVTNNVSRVTFNYIKANPGSTRKEIITALEHQNFRPDSVSSLIAQMRRNKMIHETNNLYYADTDEYRPLKSLKAIKKMEAKAAPVEVKPKRKYTKRDTTGIGALLREKIENAPAYIPKEIQNGFHTNERKATVLLVRTKTPDSILKDMTVYQARELYEHLKQIFSA